VAPLGRSGGGYRTTARGAKMFAVPAPRFLSCPVSHSEKRHRWMSHIDVVTGGRSKRWSSYRRSAWHAGLARLAAAQLCIMHDVAFCPTGPVK
jgi:hypothetical protein